MYTGQKYREKKKEAAAAQQQQQEEAPVESEKRKDPEEALSPNKRYSSSLTFIDPKI